MADRGRLRRRLHRRRLDAPVARVRHVALGWGCGLRIHLCLCNQCLDISKKNGYEMREEIEKAQKLAAGEVAGMVAQLDVPALQTAMAFMNDEAKDAYLKRHHLKLLAMYSMMAFAGPLISARYREIYDSIIRGRVAQGGGN